MGFLSVIRRWALRDKMPIREIARRTGLSRNTIKKYLREGVVEPQFKTPKRPSKLDPYADRLSAWLLIQTRKSRKERRTVRQWLSFIDPKGIRNLNISDPKFGLHKEIKKIEKQLGDGMIWGMSRSLLKLA